MRTKRTSQASIFDQFAEHDMGRELKGMSKLLGAQPELLDGVAQYLGSDARTGRCGMTAEPVLRCGLLKQYRQLTYEELAFHVLDSASFQAFARLPMGRAPSRATLQANISAITADTWEAINQQLMAADYTAGVERGTMWRVDSTAIEAPVHEPRDSTLSLDGVRVMVRLLTQAEQWSGAPALDWHNHMRRAQRRAQAISHSRSKKRRKGLCRDLIEVTQATLGYLAASRVVLQAANVGGLRFDGWESEAEA